MKDFGLSPRLVVPLLLLGCLCIVAAAHAGPVVYLDAVGKVVAVDNPAAADAVSALNALAGGPPGSLAAMGVSSAVPRGTRVLDLNIDGNTAEVNFSGRLIAGGVDDARIEAIFQQVKWTLWNYGIDLDIAILVNGIPLADFAPAAPVVRGPGVGPPDVSAMGALTGKSMTLSPGHGIFWNGSGWYTMRPVYCAPLNEEDFHNLENSQYLETYLAQDGMTVKMVRCTDKNYGNHYTGHPWWKMAASYWLQHVGYPCSVYGSSTGCTLGSGPSESGDDIRARPLASDYDGTDIYISLHTNGYQGDCTGSCPTGSDIYYDCSSEHAPWCSVSQTLANTVNNAMLNAIQTKMPDSDWVNRGTHDSNGAYGEIRIPDRAAILIELGFHDTCDHDAVHLRDNFFRSTAMWGIYKGVCDYFSVTPGWDYYSDEYVSDTIPATMAPGEYREVTITFRNRGVLWTEAYQIRLGAVDDSDPFSSETRYNITGEVGPNETYIFTLDFTAPMTEGPYLTDWRMVRESVTWFGATVTKTIQVGGEPDTEPPTVPQNLVATPISTTQIDLTWDPSTDNVGVAGYKIYRDSVQIDTSPTNSYSDTSCSPSTTYTYEVSAYDASQNESAKSAPAVATTPQQLEYIIDNPDATFTGSWVLGTMSVDKYGENYHWANTAASETATAEWRPDLGSAGDYDVYCWYPQGANRTQKAPYTTYWNGGSQTIEMNQQAGGGQWNLLVSSKPFLAGTAGYVKLGNGTGEASLVVMADAIRFYYVGGAPDTEPPTVPQNLVATPVSPTQIDLTWDPSTDNVGVVGYKIYRDSVEIDTSPTNSYSDTSCSPSTTYTYEVSAYDAAENESGKSDPAVATTPTPDTEPPTVPQNLVATPVSQTQIDLTWDPSTDNVGVVGYKIYRDSVEIDTSPTNDYSDTTCSPSTTYTYEVSAYDAAENESAKSAPAVATTPGDTTPPVISNVSSKAGPGRADITWDTDEPATSQVEYGLTTSYGNLTPLDPTLVTSHYVRIEGLARKTTYHYRVRSKDAAENEAISEDYTFKTK